MGSARITGKEHEFARIPDPRETDLFLLPVGSPFEVRRVTADSFLLAKARVSE